MRRWVFKFVLVLSLGVCAASIVSWIYSYRVGTTIERMYFSGDIHHRDKHAVFVESFGGMIEIGRYTKRDRPAYFFAQSRWQLASLPQHYRSGLVENLFRFYIDSEHSPSYDEIRIHFPYWCLTVLFASPLARPIWHKLRLGRRQHRIAAGLCVSCGYDLCATADRCPECGTPVPAGHAPAVKP